MAPATEHARYTIGLLVVHGSQALNGVDWIQPPILKWCTRSGRLHSYSMVCSEVWIWTEHAEANNNWC